MGKPRFTEVSEEVADMFLKANAIADRIEYLEKAKDIVVFESKRYSRPNRFIGESPT